METIRGGAGFAYMREVVLPYLVARVGVRSERGASLVEYALLVGLIGVIVIGAVSFLGNSAKGKFSSVGSSIR